MCWFAAYNQVEKNRSRKKTLLEKKGTLCEQSFKKNTIEEVFRFLVCYDGQVTRNRSQVPRRKVTLGANKIL
jgi:hypothetical protein